MKKLILNLMISMAFVFAGAVSSYAATECIVDATSVPGKISISGKLDSAIESDYISVQIMPESVVFENVHKNPLNDNWMFCDQIKADENREFSTTISSSASTGKYIAYISMRGELIKKQFIFANAEDNKNALRSLIAARGNKDTFASIANSNLTALMFENDHVHNISKGVVYEWLRAYINTLNGDTNPGNDIDENDGAEVAAQFELYCFMEALNESNRNVSLFVKRKD